MDETSLGVEKIVEVLEHLHARAEGRPSARLLGRARHEAVEHVPPVTLARGYPDKIARYVDDIRHTAGHKDRFLDPIGEGLAVAVHLDAVFHVGAKPHVHGRLETQGMNSLDGEGIGARGIVEHGQGEEVLAELHGHALHEELDAAHGHAAARVRVRFPAHVSGALLVLQGGDSLGREAARRAVDGGMGGEAGAYDGDGKAVKKACGLGVVVGQVDGALVYLLALELLGDLPEEACGNHVFMEPSRFEAARL